MKKIFKILKDKKNKRKNSLRASQLLFWLAVGLMFDFLLLFAVETTLSGIVTEVFNPNIALVGGMVALISAWKLNPNREKRLAGFLDSIGMAAIATGAIILALETGLWGIPWWENALYFILALLVGWLLKKELYDSKKSLKNGIH